MFSSVPTGKYQESTLIRPQLLSSKSFLQLISYLPAIKCYTVFTLNALFNNPKLLVGKPEGKRTLGRPRRRWVDNIWMDLGEVEWGDVDWIGLAQDRNRWRALVNSVMNLRVP
jgi:hypothetical protein